MKRKYQLGMKVLSSYTPANFGKLVGEIVYVKAKGDQPYGLYFPECRKVNRGHNLNGRMRHRTGGWWVDERDIIKVIPEKPITDEEYEEIFI